ncbi:high affinity glucose transporter [Coemansia sp. RSA 1200]|nr:high affinity glucose transporter [Coemansia sp. RSA 1200]
MVYLVVASFAFSWGPCGWLIPSEIFPTHLRAKANSLTTGTNWISNFVVTLTTPVLLESIGWKLFMAYSIIMAGNFVIIYLFLPETKNLTLEEMDLVFMDTVWAFNTRWLPLRLPSWMPASKQTRQIMAGRIGALEAESVQHVNSLATSH